MEYQILHLKSDGETEPCETISVEDDSLGFVTDNPELVKLLDIIKQQGYVPRFHYAANSVP